MYEDAWLKDLTNYELCEQLLANGCTCGHQQLVHEALVRILLGHKGGESTRGTYFAGHSRM